LVIDGKEKIKSEHFDFLGFRFKQRYLSKHIRRKEGGKISNVRTLVLINPDRIKRHKASISTLLRKIGNVKDLIRTLNLRIIGWCNYFRFSDAKEYGDLPRKMDIWLNSKIRKWIRRTTKLRGKVPQFWKQDTKDWILYFTDDNGEDVTLVKYSSFKWRIYDYKAINSYQTPYMFSYKQLKNSIARN
jgi:RNA-directed DNA polymerase